MQKVMIKGLAKDEKTLKELGVTRGSKVMVVGSKLDDVVSVNTPKSEVREVANLQNRIQSHRKLL